MKIQPEIRVLIWNILIATIVFTGSVLTTREASAAIYYVSTNGNDINSGTDTQPFRTIAFAYDLANPGDTIIVKPGVYTEQNSIRGIYLKKSGTVSKPIVIKSEVKWKAVLDAKNLLSDVRRGVIWLSGNYNIIDGFDIQRGKLGIVIYGNHNEIRNNHIHNNGNINDPNSSSGYSGIYTDRQTSGNIFLNNYVHHNGRMGSGISNAGHGLYLCGDSEVVVNNIVKDNAAYGLQIAGYDTVSNMRVYNNVFSWNNKSGIVIWKSVSKIDIKNNIFYKNDDWAIHNTSTTGRGVVFDSNIFYQNLSGTINFSGASYSYDVGKIITADPLFINDNTDFRLQSNSPAIDAGIKLADVISDFDGNPRGQDGLYDIGAYEYQGKGKRLSPPTNLRVVSQ